MKLERMTRDQLLAQAEGAGIEISGKPTKQQLIEMILTASENSDEAQTAETAQSETENSDAIAAPLKSSRQENKASAKTAPRTYDIQSRTERRRRSRGAALAPKPVTLRNAPGVITIDGKDKFKKTLSEDEQIMQDLVASMDPNIRLILSGKVLGYAPKVVNGQSILLIKVAYKNTLIHILPEKFFPDFDQITAEALAGRITKWKNCTCNFLVDYIDPNYPADGTYVMASRLKAMNKEKNKMWNARIDEKDEDGNKLYYLRSGVQVDAKIVTVIRKGLRIEIFGVESFVPNEDLFWIHKNDARDDFHAGEKITVMLKSVKRTVKGPNLQVEYTASHKLTVDDPQPRYFGMYDVGDSLIGTVTGTLMSTGDAGRRTLRFFVNVNDQISVLCTMQKGVSVIPAVDDKVDLRITNKYYDSMTFNGEIFHKYVL